MMIHLAVMNMLLEMKYWHIYGTVYPNSTLNYLILHFQLIHFMNLQHTYDHKLTTRAPTKCDFVAPLQRCWWHYVGDWCKISFEHLRDVDGECTGQKIWRIMAIKSCRLPISEIVTNIFRQAGVTNIRRKHRCSQSDFIKLKSKYIHNMHCNHIITSTISINGHIMFLDSKNAWLAHFRNTDYKKPKNKILNVKFFCEIL